jgi:hypothetical protein
MTAASALADADLIAGVQGSTNVKLTPLQMKAYMAQQLANASTASQTINASTTALLTGSTISVPTGKLRVGTVLRWSIAVSKTAAGTAGNVFAVQLGTAGSTADADVLTFTTPTATGVIDQAIIDIFVTVRGPLSGSGILQGCFTLSHNLAATGFATVPVVVLHATSGSVDVTVANLIASIACTTAALTVLTFPQIMARAYNL